VFGRGGKDAKRVGLKLGGKQTILVPKRGSQPNGQLTKHKRRGLARERGEERGGKGEELGERTCIAVAIH